MHPKILLLPESVINQIAAGEVVENPASIVKELIENSLDAGATRIDVEIVGGGQQLIRVEDDGCGMSPEDALRCLERHATSKIRAVEDLQELATMGFRGEALAAISAVSHFELKTADGSTATRVVAEGGRVVKVEPCARNRGATIEVRSLFYNVPARKKFQKSVAANTAQVTKVVEILAMAHPKIAFTLTQKGSSVLDFRATTQQKRIEEVMGAHELSFHREANGWKAEGYAGAPAKAMATRTAQHVFINRRPIFSPLIARAVKESFGTRIGEHAYPPFVLFLEMPPDVVDVNVHPQKKEARFSEEGRVFRFVQDAVSTAFAPPAPFTEPLSFTEPRAFSFCETFLPETPPDVPQELALHYLERPLALLGSYLLLQQEQALLIDLRAAHARVLFESLQAPTKESQALIWPLEIDLQRGEEDVAEGLAALGIECRVLPRKLVVDALPPFLETSHFPLFFARWKEKRRLEPNTFSFCRLVKKEYAMEEAMHLWRRLQTCTDRLFDPLGNRIWTELNEQRLQEVLNA